MVKASGCNLGTLTARDIVECRTDVLLALFNRKGLSDTEIDRALMASRADRIGKKPSVEALFHAYFLTLPNVEFVGHTHPLNINSLVSSSRAREFATKRVFPDEVVCCDVESVFVPYTDPGLQLARAIRRRTQAFIKKHGRAPRVILLENHGIITLGRTVEALLVATLMAEKAAQVWLGGRRWAGRNS